MALSLYQNYPVSFVGGSDSHTPEELGGVATRIGAKIRTRSDLIKALKEGNFSLHPENQRYPNLMPESFKYVSNCAL